MFFVECENNVEHEVVSEMDDHSVQLKLMNPFYKVKREKPKNVSFDMNEKGVISYSDPFCKHCYSHKVTKHGYNVRDLILENGEHYNAKIQRYYYPVVQWEPIDKEFYYRHLLFDLVNNAPIAELLASDESTETTYNFINKIIKPHEGKPS